MRPAISTCVVDDERRGAHDAVGGDLAVVGDLLDPLGAAESASACSVSLVSRWQFAQPLPSTLIVDMVVAPFRGWR